MSYIQPASGGRRAVGIVVVVVFHVALFYALVSGLARKVVEVVRAPIETKIIAEVKPPEERPPPPPPPKLAPPPPAFIPPPEVRLQNTPPSSPAETITATTTAKPTEPVPIATPQTVEAPAPAPVALPSMSAKFDRKSCQAPDYPRESLMREEVGTTQLRVLVDVDGRPLEIDVAKTSGFRRLDDAAKKAFFRCRYSPAVVNGQPSQSIQWIQFEFTLTD